MLMAGAGALGMASVPTRASGLESRLESIRSQHGLPSLACVVIRSNAVIERAAVGLRAVGTEAHVTRDDVWHLGSVTKSMTATLAAILVDEGRLRWTETLGEAFPGEADFMDPAWRKVTLEQLLGHRGGAPDQATLDSTGLGRLIRRGRGTLQEQRHELLREFTTRPPAHPPGTQYAYSNTGYILAGAWMEARMNQSWEQLITERLFLPLGMTSAGFGPPDPAAEHTHPWGHSRTSGQWKPVEPGPLADNPPSLGPAGTVHASMADVASYLRAHLNGELGRPTPLPIRMETWCRLHTALPNQEYALGWIITQRPWAGGTAWNHTGSNTYWYCNVWVAPHREFAVVVFTNAGGDAAFKATDAVAAAVIGDVLKPGQ